jgi:iron complex transport system ATP-binding protein
MSEILLETQNLSIGYKSPHEPARVILSGVSASLHGGELVCLIGPNGAGKSTLLRTLAGLQPVLEGKVLIRMANSAWKNVNRMNERELARRLSVVLTERVDVGNLTAYALTALGRYPYTDWVGRLTSADEIVVHWALQAVGADDLAERQVHELSDGERQKVMIARSLAQEPALVILDEPTAFLDLPRRIEIMRALQQLAHTTGRAILLSIHDLDLALRSADVLWLLPPGGPMQIGAPEDLVLSGAFEAIFCKDNLEFDKQSGTFRIHPKNGAYVTLNGQGLTAIWTERALEREGFHVKWTSQPLLERNENPLEITVLDEYGKQSWRVFEGKIYQEYTSIYDLILFLRNYRREKGA